MSLKNTAKKLIDDFGEMVEISRAYLAEVAGQQVDPITGEPLAVQDALHDTYRTRAYLTNYNESELVGTNILSTDAKMLIDSFGAVPEKGWIVRCVSEDDSSWFEHFFQLEGASAARIQNVQHIRLKGDAVLYVCQLRAN